ncbi:flagellar biosynthesis protein FliQ [Chromohalobacter sp. HP20-39]|uniref:flagellar biosynthesis protein FliQ n=1 Tax=Chromohalobacter sp. HP20-39 TaxID=3079306 RepID=UPI00294AD334|nr:flagellar biosynthesis protein FliQ [Chromohalobacter sp. HP20-39]MDV6319160.1 flagellar biosynthesis protein FliQ [Chromohalobacter sp. HP20-39]
MTPEMVMGLAYRGMKVTLMLAGPLLMTALLIGLLVSLFQAATQINEMTLTFIPKILGVVGALVIAGPWLIQTIVDFTQELFRNLPAMVS